MRTAPMALLNYIHRYSEDLGYCDMCAAEAARITHKHPLGFIPSAILNDMLMQILETKEEGTVCIERLVENALSRLPEIVSEVDESKKYSELWPEHIKKQKRIIGKALRVWDKGTAVMQSALAKVPPQKREHAAKAIGVGAFCGCAIRTMLNTKRWWLLNRQLEIEGDFRKADAIVDRLLEIIEEERANVERALPLAEADSRLGWEPSMDYVGGAWHLRWKLHQLSVLKDRTLPAYRKSICKNPDMK